MADMLATPADLALLPGMGNLDDATATALLEIATATVQAAVGQRLVAVTADQVILHPDGRGMWLDLPERPVTAVTAVTIGDTAVTDWTLADSRLWRPNGWRSLLTRSPHQPSPVTITYDHGWPEGHHRLGLARAATLMLAAGAATASPGVTSESIDDYQVVYDRATAQLQASDDITRRLRATYARGARTARL